MTEDQQHATIVRETFHHLPVKQSGTFPEEQGFLDGDGVALTLKGTHRRYTVFGWDATGEGHVVSFGPMVPGPLAFANERVTGISAHPIPEKDTFIEVEEGDLLRIRDDVYRVRVDRRQYIELDHVGSYVFEAKA